MYKYNKYNIYNVLCYEDEDEYIFKFPLKITHLEMHPLAYLIKYKNITHLEPHPASYLIKYMCIYNNTLYKHKVRPNDNYFYYYKNEHETYSYLIKNRNSNAYHDEKLLKSELERLKNRLELLKENLENIKINKYNIICELETKIYKIKEECMFHCVKWLDQIHICDCGNCYNCKNNNGIDINDPGRCKHYYKIQEIEEYIEYNEEDIYNVSERYEELKSHYERENAKKNGYLREYEEDLDDDFENFSFWEGQMLSEYQINYKKPQYIY